MEMPPDEDPDVYRLPAALVRHRAATERTETGEHKLSRRRPPLCAMGRQVAFGPETMYSLEFSCNPSNWLGPVWIIDHQFSSRLIYLLNFGVL